MDIERKAMCRPVLIGVDHFDSMVNKNVMRELKHESYGTMSFRVIVNYRAKDAKHLYMDWLRAVPASIESKAERVYVWLR